MTDIDITDLRAKLAKARQALDIHDSDREWIYSISARNLAEGLRPILAALPALLDEIERLRAVTDEQVEAATEEYRSISFSRYVNPMYMRAALEAARQAGGDR